MKDLEGLLHPPGAFGRMWEAVCLDLQQGVTVVHTAPVTDTAQEPDRGDNGMRSCQFWRCGVSRPVDFAGKAR